jgi:hypothetical protein
VNLSPAIHDADIAALIAVDIAGPFCNIQVPSELGSLTRWHQAASSRPSAKA